MIKYPSTREITDEMDAVLRETKMTPEEHWAFLIENGIINRNGRVLCGKSCTTTVGEIADLNFYGNRWNLFDPKYDGTNALVPMGQGVPFSQEVFARVIADTKFGRWYCG